MDPITLTLVIEAAVAGGVGLFVGLEREHSDLNGPDNTHTDDHLGVRTFSILALFGWTCAVLGDRLPWLPPAGLVVAAGLVLAHYFRVGDKDLGLTTEVAAVATFALGMLVHHQRDLAVGVALALTLLLLAKPFFRRTIPKLRRVELTATLQLAIVLAVGLPLLPVEAYDPWGVLSPRKIGLFVVLIAGISYVGYVLNRLFGASRGAGLAGIVGGLASSTAVTVAMAQQSRTDEHMVLPGQLAIFLANTVMFARVLVITALINRSIAAALALPLGLMGVVMLTGAGWKYLALRRAGPSAGPTGETLPLSNPFALVPALKWGVVLSLVLVASAIAQQHFGDRGLLVTAAASGLADVDAVTLAVSRQSQQGTLSTAVAALAITIAVVANTLVKGTMAVFMGRKGFGRSIALVFAFAIVVGVATAVLLRLR
ncbi:MAG: MgtC/SapB family protein [Nannocystis sp.]|nr:MgtC/SapB family protein [Nannocystis sp.]MBA3549026.1 MgtC/SapB family protein [Nannocystis sp.]